jgi:hypothetical protein
MAILFCGSWNRLKQSDLRLFWFAALVLHCVDPNFGATIGASGNSQVETIEAFSALPEIPGRACADGGLDFSERFVVIGIILLEHADVAFSAGGIHTLALTFCGAGRTQGWSGRTHQEHHGSARATLTMLRYPACPVVPVQHDKKMTAG